MFEDGLTLRWNLPECGLCVHRTERVTNQLFPTSETERPISVQCVCVCVCACVVSIGREKINGCVGVVLKRKAELLPWSQ